jgi:hypothetical protein
MGDAYNNNGGRWLTPANVLILIITGILVPITAAVIPTAIDYFKLKDDFGYTSSAITAGSRTAFNVYVRNRGIVPERTVEVWVRQEKGRALELDLSNAPPGSKVRDETDHKVVSLGDLRPGEAAFITGMAETRVGVEVPSLAHYGGIKGWFSAIAVPMRVVSADRAARRINEWQSPPSAMDFVYRVGFWGFVIVVLGAAAWAAMTRWGPWRRTR